MHTRRPTLRPTVRFPALGISLVLAMLVVPATGHAAKVTDSDRDGLSDRFERSSSHTKPQDRDTDG